MPSGVYPGNKGKKPWLIGNTSGAGNKGRHPTDESKRKNKESHLGLMKKDKHWNWQGGQTKEERSWQKNQRNRVLKRLKNVGNSHTFEEWETLKAQYNWTCPCCKKREPEVSLTEDHIIPLSKGGSDNIENIQPLCRSCNCKKHTKIIKY